MDFFHNIIEKDHSYYLILSSFILILLLIIYVYCNSYKKIFIKDYNSFIVTFNKKNFNELDEQGKLTYYLLVDSMMDIYKLMNNKDRIELYEEIIETSEIFHYIENHIKHINNNNE